jgi:tricorn protease-like protein
MADGQRVITGDDTHVRIWNTSTRSVETSFELGQVRVLRLSPDGRVLTAITEKGEMRVWDLDTKNETMRGMVATGNSLTGLTADGTRGFRRPPQRTERGTVFDAKSNAVVSTLANPHEGLTAWAALSPDGTRVATGGLDRVVNVWDASTGKLLHQLNGHSAAVKCVSFSPDGTRLVSASDESWLKVWDVATGQEVLTLRYPPRTITAVGFSPDGSKVATFGRGFVRILDAK